MALLAKGGDSFDDEFKQVTVNTELLVCPLCGTEVPPWIGSCPEDGTKVVTPSERPPSGPAVPAHLLEGLDDDPDPDPSAGGDGDDEVDWPA